MSYEQKYLKYKQKYQELKKMLGSGAHNLETENYGNIADFTLTDTPTYIDAPKQLGGNDTMEVEKDFSLTETPTFEQQYQSGGAPLVMADYMPSAPLASCPGQVNPSPNTSVPMPSATTPVVTQNKNYVDGEELNTTTDLSEIQNTEDIAKLFGQFGGRHGSDSSSSSSSSSESDSSDFSDSDSF
jgi:hypothetical protein